MIHLWPEQPLALAAISLCGVTAYAAAQRTSESGIRKALGWSRVNVQKMVLCSALLQAGAGLLIGIPAAIASGHLMTAELFGVKGWNLLVLGTTTVVLGAVSLLAAALPVRRAAGAEPMSALRGQSSSTPVARCISVRTSVQVQRDLTRVCLAKLTHFLVQHVVFSVLQGFPAAWFIGFGGHQLARESALHAEVGSNPALPWL